ncbi:MAG: group II truncated hemoglobin [Proteobacteria bacterium]|nr:group II truncated hemoglobin [Pseudomonadota bacterium]
MNEPASDVYGQGDATFRAAGGETGIRKLIDAFYDLMVSDQAYATIRSWHPQQIEISRDKLTAFLCGWMGGPRRYNEKYGRISIPQAHAHLPITAVERDQWLACMKAALAQQDYPVALKEYLLRELTVPAQRIVETRAYRP